MAKKKADINPELPEELRELLQLIRDRREELSISQDEMGKELGISQNAYKDIELGYTKLTLIALNKITHKLGLGNILNVKKEIKEQSLVAIDANNIEDFLGLVLANQKQIIEQNAEILRRLKDLEDRDKK